MKRPVPPFLPEATQSAFLAALSHELRSPLQALVGWVTLLRYEGLDEPDRRAALEGIEQSIRSQTRLIDELVELAQVLSGAPALRCEPVDLAEAAGAAAATSSRLAAERGVRLSVDDAAPPPVSGDPTQLTDALTHLVTHAVCCTPSGGRVVVECGADAEAAVVRVRYGGRCTLDGHLAGEFAAMAPPNGTKRHGRLTLGLAIAKHLVLCHGGTLAAAASPEGEGSVITVRLPPASTPAPSRTP